MDDQHRKISGYRELDQVDIDTINAIKAWEASWNRIIDSMKNDETLDQRCVAIAATKVETGMMFAVKAVAKPERLVEGVNAPFASA